MRWLMTIAIVLGCGSDEPVGKTSHPAMPNQFEVGSTIDGRYRVVKKLRDTGQYTMFSVEPVGMMDRSLTMIAPRLPSAQASRTLRDAAARDLTAEVGTTPEGQTFVVGPRDAIERLGSTIAIR